MQQRHIWNRIGVTLATVAFAACNSDSIGPMQEGVTSSAVKVSPDCPGLPAGTTSITLSPSSATLFVGQSVTIMAVNQDGAPIPNCILKWKTHDLNVATVDSVGDVTGVGEGALATVTAKTITPHPFQAAASVTVHASGWIEKAPMLTARSFGAVGVLNGTLYDVGGYTGVAVATAEAYDPASDTWRAIAPMPTQRWGLAAAATGGILYAIGGHDGVQATSAIEAYDPSTNAWTAMVPMPTRRQFAPVGVVNGLLYVVGGFDDNGTVMATVEAYDPVTNSWATKASMPTPRANFAIGVVNGILYAIGGFDGPPYDPDGRVGIVEAYDPATDTWAEKASMPTERQGLAVGVVNGIIYAVGGQIATFEDVATVEAFNPATNTWSTAPSMPTARQLCSVGVINGILYAVGGQSQGGLFAIMEAFRP